MTILQEQAIRHLAGEPLVGSGGTHIKFKRTWCLVRELTYILKQSDFLNRVVRKGSLVRNFFWTVTPSLYLNMLCEPAHHWQKMSPTSSSLRRVDPSAPGSIIRVALAFESLFTVVGGVHYMFFPRHYLPHTMEVAATQVTTTALQLTQQFGAVIVLLGATVALFIPNTKTAIKSRQILYFVLLVFELLYIVISTTQCLSCSTRLYFAFLLFLSIYENRSGP